MHCINIKEGKTAYWGGKGLQDIIFHSNGCRIARQLSTVFEVCMFVTEGL